jgi:hypothetical protein
MNQKGFIPSIIAVAIVLLAAFLSQQPQFSVFGGSAAGAVERQGIESLEKARVWFTANIYPRVERGGQALQAEAQEQKDNAVKKVWEKFKNYFAEKFQNLSGTKVE